MGNTLPSLASSATRLATFVLPVLFLSLRPDFRLEHVWYVSVSAVTFQALLSVALLHWQFGKRLAFEGGTPTAALESAPAGPS